MSSRRLSISTPINVKLNKNMVVNSFIGLAIALIFDDVKELFIREILLRIVNQKMEKKYVKVESLGVIFDFRKIVDLSVNIILSVIFIWFVYTYS
tara:strand:- start:780 stop:1064 length:285 start_codon:yes stop_codon:yes gene_type:complete